MGAAMMLGDYREYVRRTWPQPARGLMRWHPHPLRSSADFIEALRRRGAAIVATLLLASCGGAASLEPACAGRPAFTESECWDPGGSVTRCAANDGSYWDKQPTGHVVHWRQDSAPPAYTVICEED